MKIFALKNFKINIHQYYLSISLTGLQCHREPSIVLMSMVFLIFFLLYIFDQGKASFSKILGI